MNNNQNPQNQQRQMKFFPNEFQMYDPMDWEVNWDKE